MMWYVHDGWGWWMLLSGIGIFLFWLIIILLIIWGVRTLIHNRISGPGPLERRDPIDIARERYARGDITKEEFDQIKKDLT